MWFDEPEDNRIVSWRIWRDSLVGLPKEEIINQVVETWSSVPTVTHLLAPDQVSNWPSPWQLITDNYYCDIAINLGIFYTLALLESDEFKDLCIEIYKNQNDWINLSSVDSGKYVLNYSHNKVVNRSYVEETCKEKTLLYRYSYIDLEHKFS